MGDPTTDNYVVTGGFFDQETFANSGQGYWNDAKETPPVGTQARAIYESTLVTHSLRADGFDASEDGTGRGTPLVPVGFMPARTFGKDGGIDSRYASRNVCDALHTASGGGNKAPLIAYRTNAAGQVDNQGDKSAALTSQTDPCTQFIAFNLRGREGGSLPEPAPDNQASLRSASGGSSRSYVAVGLDEEQNAVEDGMGCPRAHSSGGFEGSVMTPALQVRRLLPVECCRLQGFPDNYLDITINGKPAADGNKYKALGNSMAVPCMTWIGKRLQLVELFS